MKNINYSILLFLLALTGCSGSMPTLPYSYNLNPRFTKGLVEFYGAFYAQYNNKNNVLSVSLLSDSLTINNDGRVQGIGQYLYLEDVFVESKDSSLVPGVYKIDNSSTAFSAFAGKNDTINGEIIPIGSYISYYESNATKSTIKLIKSGTFTVTKSGNIHSVKCDFITSDNKPIKGLFNGIFLMRNLSIAEPMSLVKRKSKYQIRL